MCDQRLGCLASNSDLNSTTKCDPNHISGFLNLLMPKARAFVQQIKAGWLNKISCLAPASGVTKLIIVKGIILVTLCCAT